MKPIFHFSVAGAARKELEAGNTRSAMVRSRKVGSQHFKNEVGLAESLGVFLTSFSIFLEVS